MAGGPSRAISSSKPPTTVVQLRQDVGETIVRRVIRM